MLDAQGTESEWNRKGTGHVLPLCFMFVGALQTDNTQVVKVAVTEHALMHSVHDPALFVKLHADAPGCLAWSGGCHAALQGLDSRYDYSRS